MHSTNEDIRKYSMVTNEYIYENIRTDQLLDRQQQVNFIAHVPASANFDDILENLDELFVRYKTRTKQICFFFDFISLKTKETKNK